MAGRIRWQIGLTAALVPILPLIQGCASLSQISAALPSFTPPPSYGWHGSTHIPAIYQGNTLQTELPEEVPPQAVRAAAERVLAGRGYTITTSEATSDRSRLVARPPDDRLFERIVVGSSLGVSGTRVAVRIDPGGNETTSRDLLESMLTVLGH